MLALVRWGRLPLTHRLTLLFTALAASVVLGLGALFLIETERHFAELDQLTLEDKRHLIEEILRNAASSDDAVMRLDQTLSYHHDLLALVKDDHGVQIYRSKGMTASAASDAFAHAESGAPTHLHDEAASHMLVFKAASSYSNASFTVGITADPVHHTQFLSGLRRSLALYLLAAIGVCGLFSWLAARQGLAPLRDMKSRAAQVTGQKLGERMPVEAVPVEMADLAQELNRMLDRLQVDFQRLTEFSSDLAHELRTPISNLLTQTQVALANQRDTETYRDILASNAEEFERLARMVSDMLFLAKTERGVDLPTKEAFSARQEVTALAEFYDAVVEEKGVRLHLNGDGEVMGDRLMFRRAVSNLLSNALRYTPASGDVIVSISSTEQATTVAVENTGADIDAKSLPRLFDRFYRADTSRAHPESDGSGLGLAITRAIAHAHGGDVTVTSSNGRTRFTLVFPRCRKQLSS